MDTMSHVTRVCVCVCLKVYMDDATPLTPEN